MTEPGTQSNERDATRPAKLAMILTNNIHGRRIKFLGPLVGLILALTAGFGLASCEEETKTKKKKTIAPAPFTTTRFIFPATFTAPGILEVEIPRNSRAIGIMVQGLSTNYKLIDHGFFLVDANNNPTFITGPDGIAPLSFPTINGEPFPVSLLNFQAVAVAFPNDGQPETLSKGTYRFPVAALDADLAGFEADTITPYIYYKLETAKQPTLKLNIFVASGINGITTVAQAEADAEISGARQVLRKVYKKNVVTGLLLHINITIVPASFFDIETEAEQDEMLSTYPETQTHDAMNIFIVNSLALFPEAVIGLSAGLPGPFNRQGTIVSGTLAEYQFDGDGTILGFILAHEIGHFLGLFHTTQLDQSFSSIVGSDPISDTPLCTTQALSDGGIDACPDRENLMFPAVALTKNPDFSTGQGNVVKYSPAVYVR